MAEAHSAYVDPINGPTASDGKIYLSFTFQYEKLRNVLTREHSLGKVFGFMMPFRYDKAEGATAFDGPR